MEDNVEEFVPRAYQVDLFEIARKENAIIYLPTGAGKTFIAVMLIKELSVDIRRSYDEGGKNTIFIVNTVPLVTQQSEYIERLTGLSCRPLCGEMGIDFWSNTEWQMIVREHQVLVMTAQCLVNALCHNYLLLNRINLIIFDECHRAVNDHPMRQIMQQFEHCPKEEQPRTLGLSASLLNGNVKLAKVDSVIQSLEVTFHAKVITKDVGPGNNYAVPKEVMVVFDKYIVPHTGQHVINILEELNKVLDLVFLNDTLKYIKSSAVFRPTCLKNNLIRMAKSIHSLLLCTGIYGANKAALLHLIQLECMKKLQDDEESLSVLQYVITEVTKCRKLLANEMKDNAEEKKIHSYSSDQLQKLYATMKNFYNNRSDNQKFCCIVFVQQRVTTEVIFQILQNLSKHDEEYKFLKPDYIVGYSQKTISNREWLCVSKWNKEAMHRFRNGLTNCIIATDIVDEGLDIQKCTLVIRYNLPMDVRAYIQSKGRARHSSSQYILLLPKDDSQYLERYKNFKMIEYHLKERLVYNTEERYIPTEDAIRAELYHYEIEPYIVIDEDEQKNILTEQMAISVVNMYCMSLLNSKFINLAPIWVLHNVEETMPNLYKVSLQLPIISPLKTVIFGDPMPSVVTAKRSAAMKMCIELHKVGELSDKLLPNTAEMLQKNVNYLFPNWRDETNEETALLGTYKKKRHHKLQFPSALYAAFPIPENTVYIHLLHIAPKYCIPHGDNRHLTFYNLLTNNAGFCIISAKKMPQVPSFPIFMSVGELNVSVKVNHLKTTLCKDEIGYIKSFHTLIFTEIVPIIKPFLVFDNYNLDNCFLIAPVDEHCNINWHVMRQYTYIERILPPDPCLFKTNDYELALVVPNYRASSDVYIVTQICDDITPNSCFPTENFYSYVHYYKEKHGLIIKNSKQPLLEVKAISKKINYIIPRHTQNDIKNRKYANFQEHLVPELCIKINFPALYWLKATVLPSILHRVSQLLIAEDLRCTIARETKLGLLSSDQWPPLVINDEEADEPFEPEVEMSATEGVDGLQPELPLNGPEIDVLNTEVNHYPWPKDQEPSDLYKNIEDTQLIQIEHYFQFMYESQDNCTSKTKNKKIYFRNNPLVNTPPLRVLSQHNLDGPDPVQIMYALTTKMGQDAFHLERLETLGDSYLKFITSLFLYTMFPKYAEGRLTMLKGKIIGNRNLYYCGTAKKIPGRIKVDDFIPLSNFIVPAYTVFRQLQGLLLDAAVSPNVLYEIQIPKNEQFDGCISEFTKSEMQERVLNWETVESQTGMEQYLGVQTVSDKTVADCVEALLGVYLNSMGINSAVILLKWFGILPNDVNVKSLLYDVPPRSIISNINLHHIMPWASDIETKVGYKFQDPQLLLQAFTHPSYTASKVAECYQRLEFLGDAIIDFLITSYIYEYCGNLNPGALTDLRSALVNNITFACLSVRHGLHTALLSYAPELNKIIERFVRFQEERDHAVNDELLWILLEEDECNMAEYVDVPKVLGDIFEAVIGAIYVDSRKDLSIVWRIIYSFMHKEIDQFSKNIPKQPIRVLYETQGANPQFLKSVIIENTNMIMVPLKVTVAGTVKLFHGFGANKKQAKCAAAKQALKSLLYKV